MIATKPFPYGGRSRKPGEVFNVTNARDRLLLKALGKAKDFVEEPLPKKELKRDKPKKQITKVTEKILSDLSEDQGKTEYAINWETSNDYSFDIEDNKPEEEEISPRTGKPKRQYKRRDMEAE